MTNLIDFKEFKNSNSEVSKYEIPDSAVKPQDDDKIWFYVKHHIMIGPKWGFDLKKQEIENKTLGKRK